MENGKKYGIISYQSEEETIIDNELRKTERRNYRLLLAIGVVLLVIVASGVLWVSW